VLHRHGGDRAADRPEKGQEGRLDPGRDLTAEVVVVEDRDPSPLPVILDHRQEVPPERDAFSALLPLGLAVLLRDERRGGEDRVIIEEPLLDEQTEREPDAVGPVGIALHQVRGLLADLDHAAEEGVLVGRIGAVPCDDRVDLLVFGEVHSFLERGLGSGGLKVFGERFGSVDVRFMMVRKYFLGPNFLK